MSDETEIIQGAASDTDNAPRPEDGEQDVSQDPGVVYDDDAEGAGSADAVLDQARRFIGVREDPMGSNRTSFGVQFGMNAVAWCAIFVSCLFQNINALLACLGKHSYTPEWAQVFNRAGRLDMSPRKGDVAFMALHGPSFEGRWRGIHHVGVVETVRPDGRLVTIEGNVSDQVQRVVRAMSAFAGFGHPDYDASAVPVTPPTPAPAPGGPAYPGKELRKGSRGSSVRLVQARLNELMGAGLAVDGDFGPLTHSAVRRFQAARRIAVDGIVGPQTWGKLW